MDSALSIQGHLNTGKTPTFGVTTRMADPKPVSRKEFAVFRGVRWNAQLFSEPVGKALSKRLSRNVLIRDLEQRTVSGILACSLCNPKSQHVDWCKYDFNG
jgi:hypothetical protein